MNNTKTMSKTALLCRYAVCITLLIVCAQITIVFPFTIVPVTLAFFMVYVIGGLLGPFHGALCMLVYIIMGLIGIPVFAGFNSFSSLAGPTGGYIVGYVPMAAIIGMAFKSSKPWINIIGMILGTAVCYLFGALWYSFIAEVSFAISITLTVLPFILADTMKMLLAYFVIKRLKKISL